MIVDARRFATTTLVLLLLALLSSCSRQVVSPAPATGETKPAATFVNKVWQVKESPAVQPGTLYVFLSEGTLLITSTNSKPALGTWRRDGDGLTMVEESIPYKVEILNLTDEEFRIRSHNPGGAVDIQLMAADRHETPRAPLTRRQR